MSKLDLIDKTNNAISELVRDKYDIQKAYNYYNGIRDADLFKFLEENFGLGLPTSIEFTPVIKKHIDALLGEYLTIPVLPKISCKDEKTISNIYRDKLLLLHSEIYQLLESKLLNTIINIINDKAEDPLIKKELDDIRDNVDSNFVSEYEIAAQNIVNWIMQSKETDMPNFRRHEFLDMLIAGFPAYKVKPSIDGNSIKLKVLDPRNVFPDRNFESPYLKDSYRIVVRYWMSKSQVLNEYKNDLKTEDKEYIEKHWDNIFGEDSDSYAYYANVNSEGILGDREIGLIPGYPYTNFSSLRLIPVYEVEWLETDKDGIMQRYETVRIGSDIFILKGKNEHVQRSISNPSYCSLSVNGVFFVNRTNEPYSLVLACAHLLDKYDLLCFYRDNLIASGGTVGLWVDETLIPEHLGTDLKERFLKWLGLKKLGIGLINTAQEGRIQAGAPINTMFNGFDDTVKAQSILAIQMAIEAVEEDLRGITGVFRERLGGIQQRDAVSNVLTGMNNSYIITKQYYHQMDMLMTEILNDCLNLAKTVFKKGITGTLILGEKQQKLFTALPEHFTITDFDIKISDSNEALKDLELLKQLLPDLMKSGLVPPEILFDALTTKSVTLFKQSVKKAIEKLKKENDQLQKLALENQLLQQQLKEMLLLLEQASKKLELLNEKKLQIESEKILQNSEIEWFKAKTEREYKQEMIAETKRRTNLEIQLLHDGNPNNDRIRQVGLS